MMVKLAAVMAGVLIVLMNSQGARVDEFTGYEKVVQETHEDSLALRQKVLRETVAKDEYWIKGNWGETIWCLAALYSNQKVDKVNQDLLENANAFLEAVKSLKDQAFRPETSKKLPWPWAYFALTDYTRILCMFHSGSPHYPGRLRPETESAMKESLWLLVKSKSKVKDASLDQLLVHHGTENHDLTLRPNYYLIASVLKDDPAFKGRKYDDGKTAAEHYEAYNEYFREWPRKRAMIGMWFEMGSDTYQKYSWPALFNLHELSPDPLVRKRFGMLLDIALVEEAQVSVRGRRGGGRNRAKYGKNSFESYKNLLYAPDNAGAGSSHSKVIETSKYQAPAAAIMLRKMAFPSEKPFLIRNRVPGEMHPDPLVATTDDERNSYVEDSALVNYVLRTQHYVLGCTLQNPALSMERDGKAVLKYSGISRQNRWSGILFDDPEDEEVCAVFPEIEKTRGGRPQHPHWSFQYENVLFMQRIAPGRGGMGSYSTGRMGIRFHGSKLQKTEKDGWIFASNGKAFSAVKCLDGVHEWDESSEVASPANHKPDAATRFLMHAGDVSSYKSFDEFKKAIIGNTLKVDKDRIEYSPFHGGPRLECFRYDVKAHETFKLPRVNGEPVELRPEMTYNSRYLKGRFGDDKVTVTVGPVKRVYDFGAEE